MKLYGYDREDKKKWDEKSDIYGILIALDGLEEAFINGAFDTEDKKLDYEAVC